ncbi:aminoglycoside phosphotransferase family protein [Candidatus Chloroploca asiatica]|uniref:Aminoglycoside phosphotransferase domain-containing protein n=1 Tax=Candidatus Chloroploca asiatica TaxID=1506545 RepID=A0A2H3KHR9_9CHLR|nr:aminoglycoside phosphotransferase family protein [Candidatus Chloroploca asiatica]PDV97323.1 hypothetical protein A9Q02_18855 [Candidatus Chloroploca asiatica]
MSANPIANLATLTVPYDLAAHAGLAERTLHLRRAWPRSSEHLLLEYEAPGSGMIVPAQWHALSPSAESLPQGTKAENTVTMHSGTTGGRISLHLHGADRRLVGLAALVRQPGARLFVHQPERRAVVRLVEAECPVFARVVRPARTANLAAIGEAVANLRPRHFVTPRLLSVDEANGVMCWQALPGVALHQLAGGVALEAGAHAAGRALREWHATPPPTAVQPHCPDDEWQMLERWLALTATYMPALAAQIAPLADRVADALTATCGPMTMIHRDFYDKQILVHNHNQIGLLDFDTIASGEPALDLANVLVHLELRAYQGLLSPTHARHAQAALLTGYAPDAATRARLTAYANATRLRLACIYSLRPRWHACVTALCQQIEAGKSLSSL